MITQKHIITTFIHCDKDWKKSDIFPNDYLDGYSDNPIEDYEASFNTTVKYYHYKLIFPNEQSKSETFR